MGRASWSTRAARRRGPDRGGRLLGAYTNDELRARDLHVVPNGDLSMARKGRRWRAMVGRRDEPWFQIGGRRVEPSPGVVLTEV